MSRLGLLIFVLLLGAASLAVAQEPYAAYESGMPDPYAGPAPSGMRFGDAPQSISVETAYIENGYGPNGCPGCMFGVKAPPCDPAWTGPCMDWKLIGWYSSWRDGHGGCGCRGYACRAHCRAGACNNCCCY